MKCPGCKTTMKWQEGLLSDSGSRDMAIGRHYCLNCRMFETPEESKGIKRGRSLAHSLIGVHFMNKKVTGQSCAVQIGLLRERQHCKTCGKPRYGAKGANCKCIDCTCLYCTHYK